MSTFYTLLTTQGAQKVASATSGGTTVALTEMAVGDGNGAAATPTEGQTALVNEVYRAGVASVVVDPANPNWVVAELVIPMGAGGWTVREVGLFATDGSLFAVANFPPTYKPVETEGSGRELTIRLIVQVSNADSVTLEVDPSITFASHAYVDDAVAQHAASRDHPYATTTAKGFVELATSDEVAAGLSGTLVVTPAGLNAERSRARPSQFFMGQF